MFHIKNDIVGLDSKMLELFWTPIPVPPLLESDFMHGVAACNPPNIFNSDM